MALVVLAHGVLLPSRATISEHPAVGWHWQLFGQNRDSSWLELLLAPASAQSESISSQLLWWNSGVLNRGETIAVL